MANDYEFSRTSGKCRATDRPLAEGEVYYTVLSEGPEGLERHDYSLDVWEGPPSECFCYWRARIRTSDRNKGPAAIDHEVLTHLFLSLEDDDSSVKQEFRFVLALLLLRKRLLRLERSISEGDEEYWQMRLVRDQSGHRVLNPKLTEGAVERLSVQLTAILGGEVDAIESLDRAEVAESPEGADGDAEAASRDAPAAENDAADARPEAEESEAVGGDA